MMEKNGLPALSLPLLLIFARPFTYLRKKFQKLVLRAQISIYVQSSANIRYRPRPCSIPIKMVDELAFT